MTEYLWSPWRIEYIKGPHDDTACIFCEKPAAGDDETNLILARNEHAFVLLNAYPYNPGHVMVAPFRHTGDLESLSADEWRDTDLLLKESVRVLRQGEGPHGFNLGMNLSRTAGAGIPDHLHFHVVPRWNGDTNFMPVLGEVKVIGEHLEATLAKLREGLAAG